jgi:enoyl-CoA hydratase/carnithine racemase
VDTPRKYVQLAVEDHIARVRLNRPPVNALGQDLVAELAELARSIHQNEDVWVVTLRASGRAFCAGADLKERAVEPQSQVMQTVKSIQDMVVAWIEVPQPVLAAIHGAALGGGLELALAADIIVSSEAATLGFPEVSLGIIPGATGTQRLAQRTTRGVANKWVLSGSQFNALEALEDGVVDYVFPQASFEQEFNRVVSQVVSCAPIALRQAKKALNGPSKPALRRGLIAETDCYAQLIATEDRTEALRAFAENRKPIWRGK